MPNPNEYAWCTRRVYRIESTEHVFSEQFGIQRVYPKGESSYHIQPEIIRQNVVAVNYSAMLQIGFNNSRFQNYPYV